MNHKVLLADDSLTIQKVIKITLANQPFEIVDCSSDEELFKKLPEVQPELVFLDFNLSEKYTGYELTSKIRTAVPSARVLLLLGTFDTVDEQAMEKCGASDKIVKPFDSNKFIAICKRLVDTAPLEELTFPEIKKDQELPESEENQWQVTHTVEHTEEVEVEEEPSQSFDVRNHLNPLDQEVSDWGMSVPGVISDTSSHSKTIDLPPIIGNEIKLESSPVIEDKPAVTEAPSKGIKFPESSDLDYPTIEELNEMNLTSPSVTPVAEEKPKAKSKLISIETFNQEPEIEFQIEHTINSVEETDVSSIEAQIRDEVEEDLWHADEFEDLKQEVSAKIEEVKNNFQPSSRDFDESLFKPLDENEEIPWTTAKEISTEDSEYPDMGESNVTPISPTQMSHVSPNVSTSVSIDEIMQQLRPELESMIKKQVKEYMDQMFQQNVEKISWEIIPDLAENLIRQEISKISNKILDESN